MSVISIQCRHATPVAVLANLLRRFGLAATAAVWVLAGCGGGGGTTTQTVTRTVTRDVPRNVVFGLTTTPAVHTCTGPTSTCIANGLDQYQISVTVSVDGDAPGTQAPVALIVTAPEGARIHTDSAAGAPGYQQTTVAVIPDGPATIVYVRATSNGTYTVEFSHPDADNPNLGTLVRMVPDLAFIADPNVPVEVEFFEALGFVPAFGGTTTVKARLKNGEGDVITGAAAGLFQIAFTSVTDPLGYFLPTGTAIPSTVDGVAQVTFGTNGTYPDGGTITLRASLVGTALHHDRQVTIFENLGAPIYAEYGVISRAVGGVNPSPIPSYLANAPGGLDGFTGKDTNRADTFRLQVRVVTADEFAQGVSCNALTPGEGNVVCMPDDVQMQLDCLANDELAAAACQFADAPGGPWTASKILNCGAGGTDSCIGEVYLKIVSNSVRVRAASGFTKIIPSLRVRTLGTITTTQTLNRRYGNQSAVTPTNATWNSRTFIGTSVAGEENLLRFRPDVLLPFMVKWVEPVTASAPTGGCQIIQGGTGNQRIVKCTEDPSQYASVCFGEGGLNFNAFSCAGEIFSRCPTVNDVDQFREEECTGSVYGDVPRIPLRLELLPSTCRSVADLTDNPDDCYRQELTEGGLPSKVKLDFTYLGLQTQPPYVVRSAGLFHNSSVAVGGQDNINIAEDIAAGWFPLDNDIAESGSTFLLPPLVSSTPANPYRVRLEVEPVSSGTTGLNKEEQNVIVNPGCFAPASVTCTRTTTTGGPACLQPPATRIQANNNADNASCARFSCEVKTFGQLFPDTAVDSQVMCPAASGPYVLPDDANYQIRFIDVGRTVAGDEPVGDPDGQEIDADGGSGESNGVEVQFSTTGAFPASNNFTAQNQTVNVVGGFAHVYARVRSTSRANDQTANMIARLRHTTPPFVLQPATLLQQQFSMIVDPDGTLPGRVVITFHQPDGVASGTVDTLPIRSRHAALDSSFAAAFGITTDGTVNDYRNQALFSKVARVRVQRLNGSDYNGTAVGITFALSGSSGSLFRNDGANNNCQTTAPASPVTTSLVSSAQTAYACVVSDGNVTLAPNVNATTTVTATLANCPVAKQPLCQTTGNVNVRSVRRQVTYRFPMTRTSGTGAVDFAGFTLKAFFNDQNIAYVAGTATGQDILSSLGTIQSNVFGTNELRVLKSAGDNDYLFPSGSPGSRDVIQTIFRIREQCASAACALLADRVAYDPAAGEITSVPIGTGNSEIFRYNALGEPVAATLRFDPPSGVHAALNYGQ